MTTIAQLPVVPNLADGDLLPISHEGLTYSVSVSQLNFGLQPVISIPSESLLGRTSIGSGGPETVSIGLGLEISSGALVADGLDHANFPLQASFSLSDNLVINNASGPRLLPFTLLRSLYSGGTGIAIDENGVISATVGSIAGPAGPQGPTGPEGQVGPVGPAGPSGSGLVGPVVNTITGSLGTTDYVPVWQNGALVWITYAQLVGGQTINELPAASAASDNDQLLVSQSANILSSQSFGSIWTYIANKIPTLKDVVVEIDTDTSLSFSDHNEKIIVVSQPLTLSANFLDIGSGFSCKVINLSSGSVAMGKGISSGSNIAALPPGGEANFIGISYSGGSVLWWNGIISTAPMIVVQNIIPPAPNTNFIVSGSILNANVTSLDYSIDGGKTWSEVSNLNINSGVFSFTLDGLAAGSYTIFVRGDQNQNIIGISNNFTIQAPSITFNNLPDTAYTNIGFEVAGNVSPAGGAVRIGFSNSQSDEPANWVQATVDGANWYGNLMPAEAGNIYVVAQYIALPTTQVYSEVISVLQSTLSISVPDEAIVGAEVNVTGLVNPPADIVQIQISNQNLTLPTAGWIETTNQKGVIQGTIIPTQAGQNYVWARDENSSLTFVSSPISVISQMSSVYGFNNPGGQYVHGAGAIGLNGTISVAQSTPLEVALSTSNLTIPSTGWEDALLIHSNQAWAVYYSTPTAPGDYYIWIKTAQGSAVAVSSFTILVV